MRNKKYEKVVLQKESVDQESVIKCVKEMVNKSEPVIHPSNGGVGGCGNV